jgi:hypothetical protein
MLDSMRGTSDSAIEHALIPRDGSRVDQEIVGTLESGLLTGIFALAAGGFAGFEFLDQLIRDAVDGAFFAEKSALPGDLFGLLLGIAG